MSSVFPFTRWENKDRAPYLVWELPIFAECLIARGLKRVGSLLLNPFLRFTSYDPSSHCNLVFLVIRLVKSRAGGRTGCVYWWGKKTPDFSIPLKKSECPLFLLFWWIRASVSCWVRALVCRPPKVDLGHRKFLFPWQSKPPAWLLKGL